ncbi:MAG: ParB/RepB/Spo0J family partition protein [Pseudomonadota bacterium]
MKNRSLGKGLASLLGEDFGTSRSDAGSVKEINLSLLEAGVYQPRKTFDPESLRELSDSIKRSGVLQPIIVSPLPDGKFAIVAGERRWRASLLAHLNTIPAIVKELSSSQVLEYAIVENIQREDLGVIEESEGYARLMEEFNYTQEQISQIVGKSRSHVANLLRLRTLPETIKVHLASNLLTMGHARSLVGHEAAEDIARIIIDRSLNVRQTEVLVKNWYKTKTPYDKPSVALGHAQNDDLLALVDALSENFGMKITIENTVLGGKIIFHFSSLEQLDTILTKLT